MDDMAPKRIAYLHTIMLSLFFDWDNKTDDEELLKESYISLIHEIVNTLEAYLECDDVEVSMNDKKRVLRIIRKLRQMVSMYCVWLETYQNDKLQPINTFLPFLEAWQEQQVPC